MKRNGAAFGIWKWSVLFVNGKKQPSNDFMTTKRKVKKMNKGDRVQIIEKIIMAVCREYGVKYADLCSTMTDGQGPLSKARRMVVYLACPYAKMHELGALLGRRSASSLSTTRRYFIETMEQDDELAALAGNLRIQLGLIS